MSLTKALLKVDNMTNHSRNLVGSEKATALAEHYLDFRRAQQKFADAASININNQTKNSKIQLIDATDLVLITSKNLSNSLTSYAKFLEKHGNSIHSNLYRKAQMMEDAEELRTFAKKTYKYMSFVKKLQSRLDSSKTSYTYKQYNRTLKKYTNHNLRANVAARKLSEFGEPDYLSLRNLGELLNRSLPSRQANRIRPALNVEGIGSLYGNTNGGYRRRTVKRNRN